jgi:hypothetical protein
MDSLAAQFLSLYSAERAAEKAERAVIDARLAALEKTDPFALWAKEKAVLEARVAALEARLAGEAVPLGDAQGGAARDAVDAKVADLEKRSRWRRGGRPRLLHSTGLRFRYPHPSGPRPSPLGLKSARTSV